MSQHHAYFPPMHGYYYFRPYHHSHIEAQQQVAAGWGLNPNNPYDNQFFQAIYAQDPQEFESAPTDFVMPLAVPEPFEPDVR